MVFSQQHLNVSILVKHDFIEDSYRGRADWRYPPWMKQLLMPQLKAKMGNYDRERKIKGFNWSAWPCRGAFFQIVIPAGVGGVVLLLIFCCCYCRNSSQEDEEDDGPPKKRWRDTRWILVAHHTLSGFPIHENFSTSGLWEESKMGSWGRGQ